MPPPQPLHSLRRALSTASPPPPLHLLLYQYVDNAGEVRKPFRADHLQKAQEATARGELLLGGALADPIDGAVIVFRSAAAAEAFVETDPYVLNGVVESWTVREWTALVGSLQPPPLPGFEATYEWQTVGDDVSLPAGLDVQLPLDGTPKRARIPPAWQLQVWVEEKSSFWRCDQLARDTTVGALRHDIASFARCPAAHVELHLDGRLLDDASTAEELSLFSKASRLAIRLRPSDDVEGLK